MEMNNRGLGRRASRWAAMALACAGSAAAAHAAGCSNDAEDCALTNEACTPGGSTTGGGGGGVPAGCVPSENADGVGDECGVFVSASAGDDGGAGTKDAPLRTVQAAIALAQEKGAPQVYACAEVFEGAVEVPGGVMLYGGLDCANGWRWIGETTRTTVTAAAGEIPMRMRGGAGAVRIHDVQVTARSLDPMDATMRGKSSIAAVAEGIGVELTRCALEAGDGAPGVDGALYAMSAQGGADGNAGNEACSAAAVLGGLEQVNDCGTPNDPSDDSIGGSGGSGQQSSGGDGTNGLPDGAMNRGTGEGVSICTAGTKGNEGAEGEPGAGATGLGTISGAGYAGVLGVDGGRGGTAQGGGGGGGSKGGAGANQCAVGSAGGASGASGGAGGCGGLGGKGGGPGGASIALVSVNATLTFEAVTLKAGRGATGGVGGQGQNGGIGGAGGPGGMVPGGLIGLNAGCSGGDGGHGGAGGRGGGGLGGHSLGIAFMGAAPPTEGVTIEAGDAGIGGPGADPQHDGAVGIKADVQEFL